jgi:hypothetical protein
LLDNYPLLGREGGADPCASFLADAEQGWWRNPSVRDLLDERQCLWSSPSLVFYPDVEQVSGTIHDIGQG